MVSTFNECCTVPDGNKLPILSGDVEGVAGIGHNTVADCKILACSVMGESIAFALESDIEQIADALLDGINAEVCGTGVL